LLWSGCLIVLGEGREKKGKESGWKRVPGADGEVENGGDVDRDGYDGAIEKQGRGGSDPCFLVLQRHVQRLLGRTV
jgi:hypothetical protein